MVYSFFWFVVCFGSIGRSMQGLILCVLLVFGGCVSVFLFDGVMIMVQIQLQVVCDVDVVDYVLVDLGFVQNKFQQVQVVMVGCKYVDVVNFVDEVWVDVEFVLVKVCLGMVCVKIQVKVDENVCLCEWMEQVYLELFGQVFLMLIVLLFVVFIGDMLVLFLLVFNVLLFVVDGFQIMFQNGIFFVVVQQGDQL